MAEIIPLGYITPDEMSELERQAVEYGLSVRKLMENAGMAVADFVLSRYGRARRACVVCGGGNNGGDGMVAARYLSRDREVDVILLTKPERVKSEEARANWRALVETKARVYVADNLESLEKASTALKQAQLVVVAIFGTGVKGGVVREPYSSAISLVNRLRIPKVAIDLPSGIDPATGAISSPTVRADVTVALHMPKVGLKGREDFTGELVVVPIGIRESGR